jgi:catechol 2,3-dioxygenase-like lactoylglutathione lyase family enzyme
MSNKNATTAGPLAESDSRKSTSKYTVIFDHVALSVNDVDKSVEFYQKTFNLKEITNRTRKEGIRWLSFDDGRELHLISIYGGEVKLPKAVHFAISTSQFDTLIQHLEDINVPYTDWPGTIGKINFRADGIKQVFLQDPDDFWIEINSVGQ